jgi:hypothetical protein
MQHRSAEGHAVKSVRLFISSAVAAVVLLASQPAYAQQQAAPELPDTATEPQGFLVEPLAIERAVLFGDRHMGGEGSNNGIYQEFGNMVPGAGWLAVGPGYRRWFKDDAALFDASAAISWRGYKTAQARYERLKVGGNPRLALGSQFRWQDFGQVAFFGSGTSSLESDLSEYHLRSSNLVGYAAYRPARWAEVGASVGWLQPSILDRGGFFKRPRVDASDRFADDIVYTRGDQPGFVHSEASVKVDTRDFAGHPSRGGLYRTAVSRYSDRDNGLFSFTRYEAEAAQFLPVGEGRVVLAVHTWLVGSDTGDGQVVPFYLQPSLGGSNSLRSYADYRFHDRNLLLLNVEGRVALMTHVDAAVFMDAGNVAARFGDLSLDKRSYGVGLRLHSRRQTFARVDLAHGGEGWRVLFRLTEPLSLSRVTKKTAAAPFVP